MESIRVIVELRFKKPAKKYEFVKEIVNIIAPGKFPSIDPIKEGTRLAIEEEKTSVILENSRVAISIEQPQDFDAAILKIKNTLTAINGELNWDDLLRIGVRTYWGKPVSLSFESLCGKFKTHFFKEDTFVSEAKDVAIPLTFDDDGSTINFNFGPMKKEQLAAMMLEFKHDSLPSKLAFVDIDYYSLNPGKYSEEMLSTYLDKAIAFSKEKSEESVSFLGA